MRASVRSGLAAAGLLTLASCGSGSGSVSDAGSNTDGGYSVDAGSSLDTGSGVDAGTGTGTGTGTGVEAGAGLDAGFGLDSSNGLDGGVDAGSVMETGSGVDAGSGSDASGPDANNAVDAGSGVDAGATPDTGIAGSDAGSGADTGPDAKSDGSSADAASDGGQGPSSFHCVNWADQRDNFVNGLLQISGLASATDTYATVETKSAAVLSAFQTNLQANAIRIPINEPTVSGTWWTAYKGVIDTAVAKGMKVVIAYWAYQNGKPDSVTAYNAMWQTVVSQYESNDLVYFDIHNEPYGYSGTQWITFAEQWLTTFSSVPRDHVIIAGTGYDQNVTSEGAEPLLNGTILNLHVYTFFSTGITTAAGWTSNMTSNVGSYASRTLVSEWGSPMTTGVNYDVTTDGDAAISYMNAVPSFMHDHNMGSCFWPGLRIGDSWSITTLNGTGTNLSLTVTNASGLDRIHWAWDL